MLKIHVKQIFVISFEVKYYSNAGKSSSEIQNKAKQTFSKKASQKFQFVFYHIDVGFRTLPIGGHESFTTVG